MDFWVQKIKHNGILLMILASILFSIMGAMAKLVMHRLPFMEAVFFRALITFIFLAPYLHIKKIPFFGTHKWLLFVRSFSGFVALSLAFYVTTQIPLADAALLNHTSTIFVALFSVFFLGENLTPLLGGYILLAFGGAAMIIKPGFEWNWQAGMLGLASGLFAAFAYIAIKKLHHRESFLTMVFDFSLVSAIGSLIWLLSTGGFVPLMKSEWFYVGILGVSGTFAQMLMTYAYKYAPASIVSPYQFSTVLFSALWGVLFWGEMPDVYSLMGAALIIACGVGILRINKKGIEEVTCV
ncbi:MAG: Transporter [uncultured bacterium]|nr:MAG: Transporter [uncultured bacterium]